jgi:hypothetical protein
MNYIENTLIDLKEQFAYNTEELDVIGTAIAGAIIDSQLDTSVAQDAVDWMSNNSDN